MHMDVMIFKMKDSTDHKLTLQPKVLVKKYSPDEKLYQEKSLRLSSNQKQVLQLSPVLIPPLRNNTIKFDTRFFYPQSSSGVEKTPIKKCNNNTNGTGTILVLSPKLKNTTFTSEHKKSNGDAGEMLDNQNVKKTLFQPPRRIPVLKRKRSSSGESETTSCSSMTDYSNEISNDVPEKKLRKRASMFSYNEKVLSNLSFFQALPLKPRSKRKNKKKRSIARELDEKRKLGIIEDLKYVEVVLERTPERQQREKLFKDNNLRHDINSEILKVPCLSEASRGKAIRSQKHYGYSNIVISLSALKLKQPSSQFSKLLMYNFLSSKTIEEFISAFKSEEENPTNHAILLSSTGPVFCSGLDPWMLLDICENQKLEEMDKLIKNIRNLVDVMSSSKKPIICLLQGPAVGLGATLALHCDLVYASEKATLQWPCVKQGLPPLAGSSHLLKSHFNRNKANSLLLQGEVMTAESARINGFISDVFCHDSFKRHAFAIMDTLTAVPSKQLLKMKRFSKKMEKVALAKAVDKECKTLKRFLSTEKTWTKNLRNYIKHNLFLFT